MFFVNDLRLFMYCVYVDMSDILGCGVMVVNQVLECLSHQQVAMVKLYSLLETLQ